MKSLRILLVMLEAPLPFGNAAARWFYVLLKGLVERGHRVSAFAACSKSEEIEKVQALFPAPEYDVRCYPFPERSGLMAKLETIRRPYSRMFSPELRQNLEIELAKPFDILHLEQLWSGWLGLKHIEQAVVSVHYLAQIDLEYVRPVTMMGYIERQMMFSTERYLLKKYKHFRPCSERLKHEILRMNPTAQVTAAPFGLDLTQYRYITDDRRASEPVVSLIGSMNWYPSFSAAERLITRLWPEIKQRVPAAKLQIVGWEARRALSSYLNLPDVSIEENVPDIKPYFERTSVFLYAPARGSGMKIKIMEALAFGIPVVTTSEGIEGLAAEDGIGLGICEDDEGLIERTVRLLENPDLQNRQRMAGRALLEQQCSPKVTLDAIEDIYQFISQHKTA